ncbi:hypothetical protein PDESU_03306 [Pontiella desulfatans]|uniref:Uncharacterized protein n=2 Tax=Pontiella desulfatans TaxID=2750659 RepID=A0A6C2U4J1_PONDE|nr:hypothetical protein PDESU_03306 [Pontiella desulfatans]
MFLSAETNFQTPVQVKGYPVKRREGKTWKLTDKFQIVSEKAEDFIPDAYSSYEDTEMKLQSATITPTQATGIMLVTLNYSPEDPFGSGSTISTHTDGQTRQSSRSDWREVPIDDERLVSSGFLTESSRDAKKAEGYKTIGIGGIEYTYEEFIANFVWSQAGVLASLNVGKTAAPAGMTGADSSKWLVAGVSIDSDGVNDDGEPMVSRRSVFKYSAIGWDN